MSTQKNRRDALLDELLEAFEQWHDKETERVDREVRYLKSVLRGRTGSDRLGSSSTEEAAQIVQNDIDAFLTGA